jgi:hypothetical protein
MFTYLVLIIAVCYIIEQSKSTTLFYSAFIIVSISLGAGNFLLYPERYGNGWDSSLKVMPYFTLKDKMDTYIIQQKIKPSDIGTQFPLIADKRFTNLSDTGFYYTNVWRGPISNYPYFLQTNIINTDIPEQIEEVKKNWILLKEFKSGMVYLDLYKNPKDDEQ